MPRSRMIVKSMYTNEYTVSEYLYVEVCMYVCGLHISTHIHTPTNIRIRLRIFNIEQDRIYNSIKVMGV